MAVCEGGMRPQRRSSWRCSEAGIRASRLGHAGGWRYPRMPREMQYWNSSSWTWSTLCSSCQSISRSNIRPGPPHPFVWGQPTKGMAGLQCRGNKKVCWFNKWIKRCIPKWLSSLYHHPKWTVTLFIKSLVFSRQSFTLYYIKLCTAVHPELAVKLIQQRTLPHYSS